MRAPTTGSHVGRLAHGTTFPRSLAVLARRRTVTVAQARYRSGRPPQYGAGKSGVFRLNFGLVYYRTRVPVRSPIDSKIAVGIVNRIPSLVLLLIIKTTNSYNHI